MEKTVVEVTMIAFTLFVNFSSEEKARKWKELLDSKLMSGSTFVIVTDDLGNDFTLNCNNIQMVILKEK